MNFKNSQGVYFTKGLFFETATTKDSIVYTLKNDSHLGYPSLYRLYLQTRDPTDYKFANEHLGGWEHFTVLCDCEWFKPYITAWRRELAALLASEAFERLATIAVSNTGQIGYTCNRYLLERAEMAAGASKRKKATHVAPEDKTQEKAFMARIEADYERMTKQ